MWTATKAILLVGLLGACSAGSNETPGEVPVFDGISDSEVITALGTEPFWSAEVTGTEMVYSTPENIEGRRFELTRFVGHMYELYLSLGRLVGMYGVH